MGLYLVEFRQNAGEFPAIRARQQLTSVLGKSRIGQFRPIWPHFRISAVFRPRPECSITCQQKCESVGQSSLEIPPEPLKGDWVCSQVSPREPRWTLGVHEGSTGWNFGSKSVTWWNLGEHPGFIQCSPRFTWWYPTILALKLPYFHFIFYFDHKRVNNHSLVRKGVRQDDLWPFLAIISNTNMVSTGDQRLHSQELDSLHQAWSRKKVAPGMARKLWKNLQNGYFWATNDPRTFDDHQIFYACWYITIIRLEKEIKPLYSDLTDIWGLHQQNHHFYPMTHKNATL